MQEFINRKQELESLEKQYNSNQSSLVVVYGRRRIGKTALITKFLDNHKNSLYFLATEEPETQNLNYFKIQVAEFTGNELLKSATVDWYTVFKTLVEYKTETKKIIVLDDGEVVGMGTHKELLKTCKVYQEIARSQLDVEELQWIINVKQVKNLKI